MILYHAISSYQLLEVMLHKISRNRKEKGILILPDFIIEKYPQYRKLESLKIFDEVYLFPYLQIPHRLEQEILKDVQKFYEVTIPYNIEEFKEIYVAGAHFYFSLYLINKNINFVFFEDAAGMLSRAEELYTNLRVHFPIHAEIAKKYGLFNGDNVLITKILCYEQAQKLECIDDRCEDFCVENILSTLSFMQRRKVIIFFIKKKIHTYANSILLTQHFSNLGIMSLEEQKELFISLTKSILKEEELIIKTHPDDTLDYKKIYLKAQFIKETFPAELLPYVFKGKRPYVLYTFNSTGCENLKRSFLIKRIDLYE